MSRLSVLTPLLALGALGIGVPAAAQDHFEIQVYGSETVPRGLTLFELHSNFTTSGRRTVADGLLPTHHAAHETVEITHGLNDWSEIGFYLFTSAQPGDGWQWVGSHVRPRVRAPASWHWPIGASLSAEFGHQRPSFSADTWTLELRPILDKQLGRWYASFNPTVGRAFQGPGTTRGVELSPSATLSVDVSRTVNLAVEYYSALGTMRALDPTSEQQHELFGVLNLDLGPEWEVNAGYGRALTAAGDQGIVKLILGRRIGRREGSPGAQQMSTGAASPR
jgi:hypothetical protein